MSVTDGRKGLLTSTPSKHPPNSLHAIASPPVLLSAQLGEDVKIASGGKASDKNTCGFTQLRKKLCNRHASAEFSGPRVGLRELKTSGAQEFNSPHNTENSQGEEYWRT